MVVEDRPMLVARLIALSTEYSDLGVLGVATSGRVALVMAAKVKPHVVLIQDPLPDADALQVCDVIHRRFPEVALIVVSERDGDGIRLLAVESGACGFVSPLSNDDDLVLAILRAAEGEFLLPRSVTLRLFGVERALRRQALQLCSPAIIDAS
jgi:two-component system nitrate/nitrite response regulator NarL